MAGRILHGVSIVMKAGYFVYIFVYFTDYSCMKLLSRII
jgi:hypothetical protein